ncbi:hypothetical protein [Leptospira yasudae]|uniref:Uncharacterized protein n=1 Tax=Leptospira yasudae TaxID=2202201 RepID=A0ABX9M3R7_9LEPT|nr:hypothetical protein [Leptospira yasudae]RHX80204.1 hypothetical protein DLM77_10170 [Leptospira yasudae]
MFLNVILFLRYFGVLFLVALIPTGIVFFLVHLLFRNFRYYPLIAFAALLSTNYIVLEGLTAFAASFD